MSKKGYLLLADGRLFEGELHGAQKSVEAELVFTTGMVGYLETITDPSYEGEIVIQTFPAIGNYGLIKEDFESKCPGLSGYVVRELCDTPCNFRCEGTLEDYLRENDIPVLTGVDTRALTKIIRSAGVMNAAILTELPADIAAKAEELRKLPFHPRIEDVTCDGVKPSEKEQGLNVVLWDFGAKDNIRRELEKRGCRVTTVPCSATCEEILALNPDGIMLSNGPGDPADNVGVIEELRKLCAAKLPMFGICLGHQLLALCQGARTGKLKYGHRGANQPAKDLKTGLSYMTSQNHGYAVDVDTLPQNASLRFVNGNDGTCEGLDYLDMPAFSVQFHPEAAGGPLDTRFLFDRFIAMMGGNKECR
ncbi:MAG: carbamoyl phosphate synthase small subunit [Clostridia bacterium]|nr:carbamoyl phosphate synthase small subunit [Clostridia bacterium]